MYGCHFYLVFGQNVMSCIFTRYAFSHCRILHNEELHILYSSPNIIRQIKSRRMRWAGHMESVGEESVQGFGGKARRKETTGKTKA
jgi:hypothetical protein